MSNDNNPQHSTSAPRADRKPPTAKQLRDREFFRRTPKDGRVSQKDQIARNSEETNREWDINQCIEEQCAIWQLRNPRSKLGKEAPKLHAENLAAEAKAQARKAKRAATQKAARQRKAAAKKAATELPPEA